jgi:peroxisomal membrane protein 4
MLENRADIHRMIFLFRSGTVREKMTLILRATRTHAKNLAKYATVYKLVMLFLKKFGATPGKEGPYDTFFAGLLGGYLVFGRRSKKGHVSSVSKQIVIFSKFSYSLMCWDLDYSRVRVDANEGF